MGGWVPIKWRKTQYHCRLITEWRQRSYFGLLPPKAKRKKKDSSRCKKPPGQCSFSPSSDKWQILHLHELYILIKLFSGRTRLLHQHVWFHWKPALNIWDSTNPVISQWVWGTNLTNCVHLICCLLLWRRNGTAVKPKKPVAAVKSHGLYLAMFAMCNKEFHLSHLISPCVLKSLEDFFLFVFRLDQICMS